MEKGVSTAVECHLAVDADVGTALCLDVVVTADGLRVLGENLLARA